MMYNSGPLEPISGRACVQDLLAKVWPSGRARRLYAAVWMVSSQDHRIVTEVSHGKVWPSGRASVPRDGCTLSQLRTR